MKVILGADHGGFEKKEEVKTWLLASGYSVHDVGASTLDPDDDFVTYANEAVKAVTSSEDRVILFCRNGFGMSITANRFAGIRCGLAFETGAVRKGRTDDDINCLSVAADYFELGEIKEMIEVFLNEVASKEERYVRRIIKIDNLSK